MDQAVQEKLNSEFVFPPSTFYKHKLIKSWKDFLKTVLSVRFDSISQDSTPDDIHTFWRNQIETLMKTEEKLCILVPAKISVKTSKKPELSTKKMDMDPMVNSKATHEDQKYTSKKTNEQRMINNSLYQCIIEVGMKIANQNTVNLRYAYDSMFLGNEKQLLVYKYCYAIEKYIEKYRITPVFKDYLDEFEKIAVVRDKSIAERNIAISFFKKEKSEQQNITLMNLDLKVKELQQKFNPYFKIILKDFTTRLKSKEISLKNMNDFILERLKPICLEQQTDIIDEHEAYELDLYRDILIVKADDPRLIAVRTSPQVFDEVQYQYTYLSPEIQIVPPDDFWSVQMLHIDLEKQCYIFKVQLRKSFEDNMPDGIFFRSKQGDQSHQQNFDLPKMCRELKVCIYPYKHGKNTYQIYVWNKAGIKCSTFSINLYNQLPLNKEKSSLRDKKLHLIASLLQPNKYLIDKDEQIDEQYTKLVKRNKQLFKMKDFYMGSTAVACDWAGNVTIWGGAYADQSSQIKQENQENDKPEQSIMREITGLCIRKVSCGTSHYLLLSIFGKIYSLGDNVCGQLGLGKSFNEGAQIYQPEEIVNFNEKNLFFTDILAHTHFSSFAITERGELYRWGLNQIEETAFPIYDRFKDIINFSLQQTNIFTQDPIKVTKKYITGKVIEIAAYAERFFALTECGDLYGWGDTSFLGLKLKNCNEELIGYIVNPLKLLGNIRLMAPGGNHCVVITKDGVVKGWGDISCFTQSQEGNAQTPINITQQFGDVDQIVHLSSGFTYTSLATKSNKVRIIGSNSNFICNEIQLNDDVVDLQCSPDSILGIITDTS